MYLTAGTPDSGIPQELQEEAKQGNQWDTIFGALAGPLAVAINDKSDNKQTRTDTRAGFFGSLQMAAAAVPVAATVATLGAASPAIPASTVGTAAATEAAAPVAVESLAAPAIAAPLTAGGASTAASSAAAPIAETAINEAAGTAGEIAINEAAGTGAKLLPTVAENAAKVGKAGATAYNAVNQASKSPEQAQQRTEAITKSFTDQTKPGLSLGQTTVSPDIVGHNNQFDHIFGQTTAPLAQEKATLPSYVKSLYGDNADPKSINPFKNNKAINPLQYDTMINPLKPDLALNPITMSDQTNKTNIKSADRSINDFLNQIYGRL